MIKCLWTGKRLPPTHLYTILNLSFMLILPAFIAIADDQMADVIAVKEGADLDLSCPILVQNEDMIISWTCDGEPANIRSSRIHVTDSGKLRIRSAKVGDSCNYRCEAADGYGTLSVITRVIIVDKKLIENLGRSNQSSYESSIKQQNRLESAQKEALDIRKGENRVSADGQNNGSKNEQSAKDLEVQVEPANLIINKNHSFTLECRVTHSDRLNQPQIIWLKEYLGRKPETQNDAQDQSLVLIDGVYYHSLNWPRSITLSRKPTTGLHRASSVLLVRHSTSVHSGHYACFAGYPPYIMSANFSSTDDPSTLSLKGQIKPVKYKVAKTHVKVDDSGSQLWAKQLSQSTGENEEWRREKGEQNLLISVLLKNSWMRNLAGAFIFICILLMTIKFIHNSRLHLRKKKKLAPPDAISPNLLEVSLAVKQLNTDDDVSNPYRLVDCRSSSSTTRATNYDKDRPEIVVNSPLNLSNSSLSQQADPTEHVYSEIGAQKEEPNPIEAYYKVPRTTRDSE